MADKRIKDLAATATSPANDDFFAIDGTTNNTRKIAADSFLQDAPSDGTLYGRQDGDWEEAASPDDIPLTATFVYDGTAETTEFIVGDVPNSWQSGNTDLTQLSIGNSATSIGSNAFNYCTGLTGSLVIPNSVTSIGGSAFIQNSLTSVTIGNSVTTIGSFAFGENLLTSVTIGNSVTTIGSVAFAYNSLTSVTFPNSVTSIGSYAFANNALTTVILAEGRTTIPDSFAFYASLAGALTIPNGVTTIGVFAFKNNSLTSVTIGNSVTTIGSFAFGENLLTSVTIGNSVTTIGSFAFAYNSLTSVTFPNSVTSIGSYAFAYNFNLATINCFAPLTAVDSDSFKSTASPLTINVPTSGAVSDTWTAGTGLTVGGNTNVTVIKNL
jgi:hypothetical protein